MSQFPKGGLPSERYGVLLRREFTPLGSVKMRGKGMHP